MTEHDKPAGQDKPAGAGGLHSPPDRGAKPHDQPGREHPAAGKETNQATPATGPTFTPEQLATPAPGLEGTRQMWIIVGPYKGSFLTMPDAEAENAKDNHWAVEASAVAPPFDAENPYEHDHDLTDEDRENAVKEANEWAAKVNAPPEPPPPEGGEGEGEATRRRQAALEQERGRATEVERAPKPGDDKGKPRR